VIDPASRDPLGGLPAPGQLALPEEASSADDVASSEPAAAPREAGFAHASEAEMSRILDFYGVAWHYEPTTFPILWNLDGDVVESFSPDFYLPDFDLYLEMTTLKQSLVRKKNRKLRRLRELYPDIRIKLFYARDFRAMMLKYGRLGLARSLSGASGQLVGGVPWGEAAALAELGPLAGPIAGTTGPGATEPGATASPATPAPVTEPRGRSRRSAGRLPERETA
jgi:hypothetical protein